jgi:hypothetical protein
MTNYVSETASPSSTPKINHSESNDMKPSKYNELHAQSRAVGETNDCTVVALAAATGASYAHAWAVLAALGRAIGKGYPLHGLALERALALCGCRVEPDSCLVAPKSANGAQLTVAKLPEYLPKRGVYLVFTRGHVLCYRGGRVHDWTEGRRHRVSHIFRITRDPERNAVKQPPTVAKMASKVSKLVERKLGRKSV